MKMQRPFYISPPRLLAAIRIADAEISIGFDKRNAEGRAVYRWYVDFPNAEFFGNDLQSGIGRRHCPELLQEMFGTFLSFLSAAAESYAYEMRTGRKGENSELFPAALVEWAYVNSEEIEMMRCEIEDSTGLLSD